MVSLRSVHGGHLVVAGHRLHVTYNTASAIAVSTSRASDRQRFSQSCAEGSADSQARAAREVIHGAIWATIEPPHPSSRRSKL